MRISFKHFGLAAMALSLGACADSGFDANALYGDLSEAQQAKYMAKLVAEFNAEVEASRTRVNLGESVTEIIVTGDAETGIITNIGTYEKALTPVKLEEALARLEKVKSAQYDFCYQPEMRALNKRGIGFQNIMKDPNGTVLYEGPLCEGVTFAPRPYSEQTEVQQAITMEGFTKMMNAIARNEHLDFDSIYEITFASDSMKDAIYGKFAFKTKLSVKDAMLFKTELGNLTKDFNDCSGEEILALSAYGISYEYRIVDHLGVNMIEPSICPATNTVALSPAPNLRGQTASR